MKHIAVACALLGMMACKGGPTPVVTAAAKAAAFLAGGATCRMISPTEQAVAKEVLAGLDATSADALLKLQGNTSFIAGFLWSALDQTINAVQYASGNVTAAQWMAMAKELLPSLKEGCASVLP